MMDVEGKGLLEDFISIPETHSFSKEGQGLYSFYCTKMYTSLRKSWHLGYIINNLDCFKNKGRKVLRRTLDGIDIFPPRILAQ